MADSLGNGSVGNSGAVGNALGVNVTCPEASCGDYLALQTRYLDEVYKPQLAWQTALSTITGIYSLIKQHQVIKEYLKLAKQQVAIAQDYLKLAQNHYHTISVPTWKCQKMLFDRYVSSFSSYENEYVADAFRLKEYSPEYKLQEGRALATVQLMFDKARIQRRRQTGKYNTGRACYDNTYFSIQQALAKTAAANHAYRFEETRKFKLDQWYWQRRTQGAAIVDNMANRVVSGLNGGASVANQGLSLVGDGVGRVQSAFQFVENGYTNLANFYGSVANTAFQFAGYAYGRSQATPFSGGGQGGSYGAGGSLLRANTMSNQQYNGSGTSTGWMG